MIGKETVIPLEKEAETESSDQTQIAPIWRPFSEVATLIHQPPTQHYVEVDSDPNADTWYHHAQGMVFKVAGTEGNSFRVVYDQEEKDAERLIASDDCRLFSSVLEFLKKKSVFDVYRDDETRAITITEMCDQCFSEVLSRSELESLAHELLIFAWSVPEIEQKK